MENKTWKYNNTLNSIPNHEQSKKICKTVESFVNYIREHKDIYYEQGEFAKV